MGKPRQTFQVGQRVRWQSQAQGYHTMKHGKIHAVIPAEKSAGELFPGCGFGLYPRGHESYVVHHNERLYWPRVSHLEPHEGYGNA